MTSVASFLRQRTVEIAVAGRYTLPRWYDPNGNLRTFACRTTRVSPFQMLVDVPVTGKVGEKISSYFHDFGKLEAIISDVTKGRFLMELEMTAERRARMADMLTWLERKQQDRRIQDHRDNKRFIPPVSHTSLTLGDGAVHSCFIINVSCSGVAVSAEHVPTVGTPLAIGNCLGRVVRHFETGFAVKFVEKQIHEQLSRQIIRTWS